MLNQLRNFFASRPNNDNVDDDCDEDNDDGYDGN